jgi:hypothetical protein
MIVGAERLHLRSHSRKKLSPSFLKPAIFRIIFRASEAIVLLRLT